MSKYKVGDKIVVEIEKAALTENGGIIYTVLDYVQSAMSIDEKSEPLSTYTEPLEAKIRRQAAEITRLLAENKELKEDFEKAKIINLNAGRLAGQKEAWELARKIACFHWNGGYTLKELLDIFQEDIAPKILYEHTYPEAAAKVEAWEKAKEENKVGDVVCSEGKYGVVISEGTICFRGFTDDGTPFEWYKERCTKTGRHIDIDSFLKQIGEE